MNNFYVVVNPLDQFDIKTFLSLKNTFLLQSNIELTNISLYVLISCILILFINLFTNYNLYSYNVKENNTISNKWNILSEVLYCTVYNIVTSQIGKKNGQIYFPFLYSLFLFILVNNLISMVPYSFASTSHFMLTFSLSFSIVLGATILGFYKHKFEFFSLFVPSGCPLALIPLLVIIEFISYLSRNVSLGLRLAANILSGHMLLSILSGFTYNIMNSGVIYFFLALLPIAFITAFCGLELAIAFIQAQVFVVLTCSYLKDCIALH